MSRQRRTTRLAGCVILDDAGRLLLIHRNTAARKQWETPGGKVQAGEAPVEAAVREAAEELGIRVRPLRSLGFRRFSEDELEFEYHWYESEILSGRPSPRERSIHDRIEYFSWDQLRSMRDQLSANMKNLFEEHEQGRLALQ